MGWNDKIGSKFRYWLKGNVSFSRYEIVYKVVIPQNEPYMYETGRSIGLNYGYVFDRFFEAKDFNEDGSTITGIPTQSGTFKPGDILFKDLNNDGVIDGDDKTYFGYGENPEYIFGLNAGFNWKGLTFSMQWPGATHVNKMMEIEYRIPYTNAGGRGLLQYFYDDCWTPEHQTGTLPRAAEKSEVWNSSASTLWLRNARYLRLKTLSVGYTFSNSKRLASVGIKKLGISLTGYNLLTFTPLDFIDPESLTNNNGAYPLVKVYSVGLKVTF